MKAVVLIEEMIGRLLFETEPAQPYATYNTRFIRIIVSIQSIDLIAL
jgi:hypothetical protein